MSFYTGQVLWQVWGYSGKKGRQVLFFMELTFAGRESEQRGTENPSTNWAKAMKEGYREPFEPNGRFVFVKCIGEGFPMEEML